MTTAAAPHQSNIIEVDMPTWQPNQYLLFETERTRPCHDLVAQIHVPHAKSIIDLGCGPGNSTAVVAERWPNAAVTGLDSSPQMLDKARASHRFHQWITADIATWAATPGDKFDIVFSNAALHWVDDHVTLYPRLFSKVNGSGAFAVQVPANMNEVAHQAMRDVAASAPWRNHFPATSVREWFVHDAGFYYDALSPLAARINLWETTYVHVLPSVEAIAEWYKSTGLRPFLGALPNENTRDRFVFDYINAIRPHYIPQADGQVLFPFRRLFLIADK